MTLRLPACLLALISISVTGALAQNIQFDGSLGADGSNGKNGASLDGPSYQIDKLDGQLEGTNLFHSFEKFGLISGETATFESTGVSNILTRVTGGDASSIDGGIVAGANLFFMNPNGVMFGPNSSLNVSGAFTATTADRLNFQGGGTFAATASALPATVTGDVTSFGFLGPDSLITLDGVNWGAASADSVHLLGGSLEITDSAIAPNSGRVNLVAAPSGATATLAPLDHASIPVIDLAIPESASITLNGATGSQVSSQSGGKIVIRGGKLTVEGGSSISSTDFATGWGGDIDIHVSGSAIVNGAITSTANSGNGGGKIDIKTNGGVSVTGGRIASTTGPGSTGPGGAINLNAGGDIALRADGAAPAVLETATSSATQPAGPISVFAGGNLAVMGATVSSTSSAGTSADITLNALGNLEMGSVPAASGTAVVPANIFSRSGGLGDGGAITLTGNHIALRSGSHLAATGPTGGRISLSAANGARISQGALLDSGGQTGGAISVNGGSGDVHVAGNLRSVGSDGNGGDIRIQTSANLELAPTARLDASGTLAGGQVFVGGGRKGSDPNLINARNVTVAPGALITANGASGDGGTVILWADGAMDFQGSVVNTGFTAGGFAEVSGLESLNFAGHVDTGGGELLLDPYNYTIGETEATNIENALALNDVTIETSANIASYGSSGSDLGDGSIIVLAPISYISQRILGFNAAKDITFSANIESRGGLNIEAGGKVSVETNVSLSTAREGAPADFDVAPITIQANEVEVAEGGIIDLTAGGAFDGDAFGDGRTGNAGDLLIETSKLTLNGSIFTRTNTLGGAGNVTVNLLEGTTGITPSATISSTGLIDTKTRAFSTGDAGDISILGGRGNVTLRGNVELNSLSSGAGGDLVVNVDSFHLDGSRVRTSSTSLSQDGAPAGNVDITAKTVTIDNGGGISTQVTSGAAGDILLQTNNLTIDNGEILSTTLNYVSQAEAGDISISGITGLGSQANLVTLKNGGKISATTDTDGDGGLISIETLTLDLQESSEVSSKTQGFQGNAGMIEITADTSTIHGTISTSAIDNPEDPNIQIISEGGNAGEIHFRDGVSLTVGPTGRIESKTDTNGNAAPITITAEAVTVEAGGVISTESTGINTLSAGNASNVNITADTELIVNGQISSTTAAEGNAGTITLTIGELEVDTFEEATGNGQIVSESTGNRRSTNAGDAGSISITADSAMILGKVSTETATVGLAGNIDITTNAPTDGPGDPVDFSRATLLVGNGGQILSQSTNVSMAGKAGNIVIQSGMAQIDGTVSTTTDTEGNAGNIDLHTDFLYVSDSGSVISTSTGTGVIDGSTAGNAGQIRIAESIYGIEILDTIGTWTAANQVTIEGEVSTRTNAQGNAGTIGINAFNLDIEGTVNANTFGSGVAGSVIISTDTMNVGDSTTGGTGRVESYTSGAGPGGDVIVFGRILNLTNSSTWFAADAYGENTGHAGEINITATENLHLSNGAQIFSTSIGSGAAGEVYIQANNFTLTGQNSLVSTATTGSGKAGDIVVSTNNLTLNSGTFIESNTFNEGRLAGIPSGEGTGDAGTIKITGFNPLDPRETDPGGFATASVTLNADSEISTGTKGKGNAGSITIQTLALDLQGEILSTSEGNSSGIDRSAGETAGQAGTIRIGQSLVDGAISDTIGSWIPATTVSIDGGLISTATNAEGEAGNIGISANMLDLSDSTSEISSSSTGSVANLTSYGDAGLVFINAGTANVEGSVNTKTQASGSAGDITFNAANLTISQTGKVESNTTTTSSGTAGNITVNAGIGSVNGAIDSRSDGTGDAGIVNFSGGRLTIAGDGFVTSQTSGSGDAGAVNVIGNQIILCDNAYATSQTSGSGQAGIVTIQTDDLTLKDGAFLTTLTSGSGNAGTIALDIDNLTLEGTSSITSTTSGSGDAGSLRLNLNTLTLRDGGSVSATSSGSGKGGNVEISANEIVVDGGVIEAQATSSGAAGSIDLDTAIVSVSNGGRISATTSGSGQGGSVTVKSRNIDVGSGGQITAETTGSGNAGTLGVSADSLTVHGQGNISATTTGSGKGGSVSIKSQSVEVSDRGQITAETTGSGNAGTLTVTATNLEVHSSGEISATTSGSGRGGGVSVNSNSIAVNTNGRIAAESTGRGNAGTLQVNANTLQVLNGGEISATTTSSGQGGSVIVKTTGNTSLANGGRIEAETRGSGNAGSVDLIAQNLFLNSGSKVSATTFGSGNSGNVTATGRNRVQINGGAGIEAVSQGTGNAGSIALNAHRITMSGGGNVSATTLQSGQGGSVQVGANLISMTGSGSGIFAQTTGSGRAGNIDVRSTTDLNLHSGASISGTTSSSGRAGDIKATAYDVNINGNGSGIFAESTGSGNAGSIDLNATGANTLRLSNNGTISSRSSGKGNAGSIDIDSAGLIILNSGSSINVESLLTNAGSIFLDGGSDLILDSSSITARAGQNAGNIEIRVPDTIRLDNSAIIAEAGSDGGNIIIDDARFLLLNNSTLSANAILGTGGFIQIGTDVLFQNNSDITASSEFGADGEVRIDALSDLSAAQAALDAALLDASNDLQERCAVKLPGQRNSFILVGRGGLPVMPGRFLPGHQLLKLPSKAPNP